MTSYKDDVALLAQTLSSLPSEWDGKAAILELRRRDYNWRQMEWIGFYFEILCRDKIGADFRVPGERYGNVSFDCRRSINWDMKASVIKTERHAVILNDTAATDDSIAAHGRHGVILALVDADYNDENRSFQEWHSRLKGGKSKYERDRIARGAASRYRKTRASLREILFLTIDENSREDLPVYKQGRNSDGSPRCPKYAMELDNADAFLAGQISFPAKS